MEVKNELSYWALHLVNLNEIRLNGNVTSILCHIMILSKRRNSKWLGRFWRGNLRISHFQTTISGVAPPHPFAALNNIFPEHQAQIKAIRSPLVTKVWWSSTKNPRTLLCGLLTFPWCGWKLCVNIAKSFLLSSEGNFPEDFCLLQRWQRRVFSGK